MALKWNSKQLEAEAMCHVKASFLLGLLHLTCHQHSVALMFCEETACLGVESVDADPRRAEISDVYFSHGGLLNDSTEIVILMHTLEAAE